MASLSELDLIKASQLEEAAEVNDQQYVIVAEGSVSKRVRLDKLKGKDGQQGEQGVPGEQGEPGVDGVTPTIVFGTIATLEPGEMATAELVPGENNQYTLNLSIPRGQNGTSSEVQQIDIPRIIKKTFTTIVPPSEIGNAGTYIVTGLVGGVQLNQEVVYLSKEYRDDKDVLTIVTLDGHRVEIAYNSDTDKYDSEPIVNSYSALKVEIPQVTDSNILTSPNGTRYKLIVADDGSLSTEVVPEETI